MPVCSVIIPVYGLFIFIDVIILNTIEFWTGSNPVSARRDLGNGHLLALDLVPGRPDTVRVEHSHSGRVVRVFHARRHDDGIELLGPSLEPLGRVRMTDEAVAFHAPDGAELARLDPGLVDRIESQLDETHPSTRIVLAELDEAGAMSRLASLRRPDRAVF